MKLKQVMAACPFCRTEAPGTLFLQVSLGSRLWICLRCENILGIDSGLGFHPSDEELANNIDCISAAVKLARTLKEQPPPLTQHQEEGDGGFCLNGNWLEFCVKAECGEDELHSLIMGTLQHLGLPTAHIFGPVGLIRKPCPTSDGFVHVLIKALVLDNEVSIATQ